MQGIVTFLIDSYKSLYLCLFQFLLRGTLALIIEATTRTQQYLGTVTGGIADGIQASINAANQAATGAVSAANTIINGANSFINNIPQVCLPGVACTPRPNPISTLNPPTLTGFDVAQIRNFNIPDTFQQQVIALNSTLPTLDQLRSRLDQLIGVPFDTVRAQMNTTFAQVSSQIGNVTLPVPAVRTVEFCSGMDMSFIDTLAHDLTRVANICIGVLVACAALVVLSNAVRIWLQYRRLARATQVVRASWGAHSASFQLTQRSLLTLDTQMRHPFAWRVLNAATRTAHLAPATRDRLAWFLACVLHPSALTCLAVGLAGLLLVCIQLLALRPIQARIAHETETLAAAVTSALASAANSALAGDSAAYARAANAALGGVRTTLDTQLFAWVDTAAGALNATVVEYYADAQAGVTAAFGNSTLFAAAASQLLDCVLGSKVNTVSAAAAFLKANLHIALPTVPDDVLLLSPALLDQVSKPVADAAVGGDDGGLFGSLLNRYLTSLRGELIMFGVILGIWFLVVLIALVVIAWDVWRARRRNTPPATAPSPINSPVRSEKLPEKSTVAEDMKANLPPL